jgi:hypothetical protein
MIAEIDALVRLETQIQDAASLVAQAPGLLAAIDCGEGSVTNGMNNISRLLGNVAIVITLINRLGSLAGLPEIPQLEGSLVGSSTADARQLLVDIRDALAQLRDLVVAPVDNLSFL